MENCFRLKTIDEIGVGEEFLTQLKYMGKESDWIKFRDEFDSPGTTPDYKSKQRRGRFYCHWNGIPVITENEVWLGRIPKHLGYVARYVDLQKIFKNLELEDAWNSFFLSITPCLLDHQAGTEVSNMAIFWEDVTRFFEQRNLICRPLSGSNQTASKFLANVAANVSLSGFKVSEDMLELASLAANGVITTEEALGRLGIILSDVKHEPKSPDK